MKKPKDLAEEIMERVGAEAIKSHALRLKIARVKSLAKAGLTAVSKGGGAVEWRDALEKIVNEVER